jgi:Family of unknown function (DUF6312)
MDKLVRRVTRVERSGDHHDAKVVYKGYKSDDDDKDEDEDEDNEPSFRRLERSVRHMLKAQVTAAQEAYDRHVKSAEKGGNKWLYEDPRNFMKARIKAMKEARKGAPFKAKFETQDDDED